MAPNNGNGNMPMLVNNPPQIYDNRLIFDSCKFFSFVLWKNVE